MTKELLPIGSVVLLKEGIRKLMIIGFKVAKKDAVDVLYDYIGVLYPEGFIGEPAHFLFNHEDINDVIFTGYTNPEYREFIDILEKT